MPDSGPRIPPLPESEWQGEALEQIERTRQDGRVLNIFSTLANHPKLMKRWLVFGNHVLQKSSLEPRERELLPDRVAHAGVLLQLIRSAEQGPFEGVPALRVRSPLDALDLGLADPAGPRDDHVLAPLVLRAAEPAHA